MVYKIIDSDLKENVLLKPDDIITIDSQILSLLAKEIIR